MPSTTTQLGLPTDTLAYYDSNGIVGTVTFGSAPPTVTISPAKGTPSTYPVTQALGVFVGAASGSSLLLKVMDPKRCVGVVFSGGSPVYFGARDCPPPAGPLQLVSGASNAGTITFDLVAGTVTVTLGQPQIVFSGSFWTGAQVTFIGTATQGGSQLSLNVTLSSPTSGTATITPGTNPPYGTYSIQPGSFLPIGPLPFTVTGKPQGNMRVDANSLMWLLPNDGRTCGPMYLPIDTTTGQIKASLATSEPSLPETPYSDVQGAFTSTSLGSGTLVDASSLPGGTNNWTAGSSGIGDE